MEETRPILYGMSDYAEIRRSRAWFIDRTAKIRDLEATRYAVFLRPRRFGKSMLLSILEAYYDVAYAERFDEFFAGTEIGANPTDERSQYLILYFNFSMVSKDVRQVEHSFERYVACMFDGFAEKYAKRMPEGLSAKILAATSGIEKMSILFSGMKGCDTPIYCLIDEYDNFTNTILAESGEKAHHDLCHGDGSVLHAPRARGGRRILRHRARALAFSLAGHRTRRAHRIEVRQVRRSRANAGGTG